jgi:serine protease SohB
VEEFVREYSIFLAQAVTVLVALVAIFILFSSLGRSRDEKENIEIKKLNDRFQHMKSNLQEAILSKDEFKESSKTAKKERKSSRKKGEGRKKLFVVDFDGDMRASAVASLREEITAILTVATPEDEVFVKLQSAGGLVHAYGLAASQLQRIRARNIPLTVGVDKVAASGGYMMACVANRIVAAPFAVIGSIGVVAQIPNFHRLLRKNDIDFELMTAGKFKRTLTLFGENSEEARAKFQQELEDTHKLFKAFITENRPQIDIDHVSTGEHWHGLQAVDLNLVDELLTSDDYLLAASETADVYEVSYTPRKTLSVKLSSLFTQTADRVVDGWQRRSREDLLP